MYVELCLLHVFYLKEKINYYYYYYYYYYSAVFEPRFQPNFRVTAICRNKRIEVQDEKGNKSVRRLAHVKAIDGAEKNVHQLTPQDVLEKYGRSVKLLISSKDIPDVGFPQEQLEKELCEIAELLEKSECPECLINSPQQQQRHTTHARSNEDHEHPIPSEENKINPSRVKGKSSKVNPDESSECSIHSGERTQWEASKRSGGTGQDVKEEAKLGEIGNNVSIPTSNWFGLQIAQFVKASVYTGNIKGSAGDIDASNQCECKTNTKVHQEFSFFL